MAFAHGRSAYLSLGGTDLSAWVDNSDLPIEADIHETTTYGKAWKTRSGGLKDFTFTFGGLYDSATGGPADIIPPLVGTSVAIIWGPEGNTTGKPQWTGNVIVQNWQPSVPVGDMIRFTVTCQANGTLTEGAFV